MFTIVLMVAHVTFYKVNVMPFTMGTCCPAGPVGNWLGKSSQLLTDYKTQLFLGQEIWKLDFKFGRGLYFLLSSSFGMARNNKVHPTGQLPGASLASAEICVTEQNWPQTEDTPEKECKNIETPCCEYLFADMMVLNPAMNLPLVAAPSHALFG